LIQVNAFLLVEQIDQSHELFSCCGTPSHESHDNRHEQGRYSAASMLGMSGGSRRNR
jgi:hypothetical protein